MEPVRLSLRTRLVLGFALVLVPGLLILAYELRADYLRRVNTILTDQLQTCQAVAALVDANFDEGLALARSLSVDPEIQSLDPTTIDPYLRRQQSLFPQYVSLAVFDAAGHNVGYSVSPPSADGRPSIADRPFFQRAMSENREQVSGVIMGRLSGRPTVVMVYPVRDEAGSPRGVVAVALDLDRLPSRLAHVQLSPGQSILLADQTGRLAFDTARPNLSWDERDYSGVPDVQRALAGENVLDDAHISPLLHDQRLAAFVPTPEHRWVVGVSQPVSIALAPVQEGIWRDAAVAGAITLLALGLGILFSRQVLDPVRRLTRYARAQGEALRLVNAGTPAPAPIQVRTGDELEVLADSLNEMASEVRRRIAEQERSNARLAALTQTAEALVGASTVQDVGRLAVERGAAILGADYAALWLAEPRRRELNLVASLNLPPEAVAILGRVDFDSPLPAARAARTGKTVVVDDYAAAAPDQPIVQELARRVGIRSLIVVPLRTRQGLAGVLGYGRHQPGAFSPPDRYSADTLADVFAVGIERAQLIEDLRAALRVRDEFLNLAAHELKTPLTTLKGYIQVLLKRGGHDSEEERLFRTINTQSDRMARLIDTLVDVSQIQGGELALRLTRPDLCALANEVARTVQEAAPRHELSVHCDGPVIVEADRDRIRSVLANLLDNAVKYSPHGGPVEITVRCEGREAVVCVTDHGIGIPKEKRAKLFEAFYQVAPMVSPTTGMGLGLFISREIIRRHGGRMWFESQEGKGSTFCFSLPTQGPQCEH